VVVRHRGATPQLQPPPSKMGGLHCMRPSGPGTMAPGVVHGCIGAGPVGSISEGCGGGAGVKVGLGMVPGVRDHWNPSVYSSCEQ